MRRGGNVNRNARVEALNLQQEKLEWVEAVNAAWTERQREEHSSTTLSFESQRCCTVLSGQMVQHFEESGF